MPEPFRYDELAYETATVAALHPDRLYVQARLFGLPAARPDRGRYLEVGAGTGLNLIAAALFLPGAEFVGIDLAGSAVRAGNELIADLGLTNVRLEQADLTAWQPDRPFDYVAAHGVYSWVPAEVRDGLLALLRRSLAPNGVGYVSYNALPGCHLRRVIWDMLRFHTAAVDEPAAKLDQCDQFLQFLRAGQEGRTDAPHQWIKAEAAAVLTRTQRSQTFHDDLAEENHPLYFLDFVGHARQHGLKYLAEAELPVMSDTAFPPHVAGVLAELGRRDPLVREQYRDFLQVRRFRCTLLCHADRDTRPEPEPVDGLYAAGTVRPVGDPDGGEFLTDGGQAVAADDPQARRLLTRLAEAAPARIAVDDLAAGEDPAVVRRLVLDFARRAAVTLHGGPFPGATAAGERPAVSPLARLQASRGLPVSNLLHAAFDLSDAPSRALLPLLDGSRTRADLADALRAAVPTLGTPEEVADGLEITLEKLARMKMLVA